MGMRVAMAAEKDPAKAEKFIRTQSRISSQKTDSPCGTACQCLLYALVIKVRGTQTDTGCEQHTVWMAEHRVTLWKEQPSCLKCRSIVGRACAGQSVWRVTQHRRASTHLVLKESKTPVVTMKRGAAPRDVGALRVLPSSLQAEGCPDQSSCKPHHQQSQDSDDPGRGSRRRS